jgi:hypothetical protein
MGSLSEVKDFPKTDQIEKFDQRQKPAKWAQLLAAGPIRHESVHFFWLSGPFTNPNTVAVFPAALFSFFNHLGTSCRSC